MTQPAAVLHEVGRRVRLQLVAGVHTVDVRARLDRIDGVEEVRISERARSITVLYDGRRATREQILSHLPGPRAAPAAAPLVKRRHHQRLSLPATMTAAVLAAALPAAGRSVVALGLIGGRALMNARAASDPKAVALNALSLATTALTGHPLTAAAAVALSTAAERWRDELLDDTHQLLAHLLPDDDACYDVRRDRQVLRLAAREILAGDEVALRAGQVIPVDGIAMVDGAALACAFGGPPEPVRRHQRLWAGDRVGDGMLRLRAEQRAQLSRAARLRAHIRHALLARDQPGPLTPDLERLLALPVAAAGLVLALTGDTARTASVLRADPQQDFALSHPVTREAALYAAARHGVLLSGLDMIDRLAAADTFAFQDIGVLTDAHWHIERIDAHARGLDRAAVERWLAALAGIEKAAILEAGLPDAMVDGWLDHGAVLVDGERLLHVGGSQVLAKTWKLPRARPDRQSLARTVGIVSEGRLLASVKLESRLRPGLPDAMGQLRALKIKRIAVFTENPYPASARRLAMLGADVVVAGDRMRQAAWLEAEVQRGRRVALVHTSMRELLPAGGLSLCPVDAEAGAHGVLLGDPLSALLSARAAAQELRGKVAVQYGASMAFNASLMVIAGLSIVPPIAGTLMKHGFSSWMLRRGAKLAQTCVNVPIETRR